MRRTDRGMATAELASVLPVVLLLLALLLGGLSLGVDQMRCVDAARLGARAAARGDPPAQVRRAVLQAAPPGSSVEVSTGGSTVQVSVRGSPRALGALLPDRFDPRAVASADREQVGTPP